MENRGLIFIPDISGFTQFINEIEITHSRNIIQELLETLISANALGLEISEIEGDAILFYKFGEAPPLEEVYRQVRKMFCDFHQHLLTYESRKYCQCRACTTSIRLTLKVITHYGEFTSYTVRNFQKLIGKDIIVAHQLLKNDIQQHEYWLVTDNLTKQETPQGYAQWMDWKPSVKHTETGDVPFVYTQIGQLKREIPPDPPIDDGLSDKIKVLSVSREFDTHIIQLFHASGEFNYRPKWMDGVIAVEEVAHFLPRVGMKCKYTLEHGQKVIYSNKYTFHPERIVLGESDIDGQVVMQYIIEALGPDRSKLTIDYYIRKNLLNVTRFNLTKRKQKEASLLRSLDNMETFVGTLSVEPLHDEWE